MEGQGSLIWPDGKKYVGNKNKRFMKGNMLMVKRKGGGL